MKAVLVHDETYQLYLKDIEEPIMGDDELLVNIKATALNRADIAQKYGKYPLKKGTTSVMGIEMAGVVEKVGKNVTSFQPGDRVCSILSGGGYAERCTIHAGMAIRIPDHFSYEEAAAIPEVYLTAYLNLFTLGHLKSGDHVLIHAGASGVGTAAIQLVREVGAYPIVTVSSEEKVKYCLELGAIAAINYKEESFVDRVLEVTDGKGADIILDLVGASYFERNIEASAIGARLILIGVMGGTIVHEVDLMALKKKQIQVIGTMLRIQPNENKIKLTKVFSEFALPRFIDGRLKPIIDSVWDLEQVNEAHKHMENNENIGKIILKVNSCS